MKTLLCMICFLVLSSSASAWPHLKKPHPIGFVKHHKLLLISSAIYLAADAADTVTTIHAQQRCPTCVESSEIFGQHPSAARLWGESEAMNAGIILFNWYGFYKANSPPWTAEERAQNPTLYNLCWLERPITLSVMSFGVAVHAHAAYVNAQKP